jgi:hypothetical protein
VGECLIADVKGPEIVPHHRNLVAFRRVLGKPHSREPVRTNCQGGERTALAGRPALASSVASPPSEHGNRPPDRTQPVVRRWTRQQLFAGTINSPLLNGTQVSVKLRP